MNIKSTKSKEINFDWIETVINHLPMDKLTFVFSLIAGILLGFTVMGFGSIVPIFLGLGATLLIASFGAMDSGSDGFIYVIRLAIYSIIVANLLVLYPSTKFAYDKRAVEIVMEDVTVKKGKRIAVTIYDTQTNDSIVTNYYTADKKKLVNKLYANTKFIKYNVQYFPLIKYSRTMEFYDD